MGISSLDLIKHANGSLKIGIEYVDFKEQDHRFFYPFAIAEDKESESESNHEYCEYQIYDKNKIPENILEYENLSVHVDAGMFLQYLDTLFPNFENLTIERKTVSLSDLTDDLVVDCTGFGRSIIKELRPIEENFNSYTDKIFNNQALVYRHEYESDEQMQKIARPYSIFKAMDHGWIWNITLGNRMGFGYVHPKTIDVKQDFINYLEDKLGKVINPADIRLVPMMTGCNKQNVFELENQTVVAVGLSSSFIEPIESTGIFLVKHSIEMLDEFIQGNMTAEEFDKMAAEEFDAIVDFIVAHYKYSKRNNDYWNLYKDVDITLYNKVSIFPEEVWNFMIDSFGEGYQRATKFNPVDVISIVKGKDYHEWLKDAKYPR